MRDKKIYLLYPNCGYCVYYMIQYQYKVISKKYKKEAVFLGKVLEYAAAPKIFMKYFFVNTKTGEKSGEMLTMVRLDEDAPADGE